MIPFTITANPPFLNSDIQAFYHSDYHGGGKWQEEGTIENMICTLKNDVLPYNSIVLNNKTQQLERILLADLPLILQFVRKNKLTVSVVPRAKVQYKPDQLLFKATVSQVVNSLSGFSNGTNYIIRHTNTKTTHKSKSGYGGDGDLPYPGITNKTCHISNDVIGKDVLLIDDLYTRSVNIDEDAIQALLDKGAKSVIFYAIGKTVLKF